MLRDNTVYSSSQIVCSGPCLFWGILIGTDGVNNPTVTVYDNTTNSGDEVAPTCEYDATLKGVNGFVLPDSEARYCENGLYIEITCAGTVEVSVLWRLPTWEA